MPGPWEKYQKAAPKQGRGPWEKYAQPTAGAAARPVATRQGPAPAPPGYAEQHPILDKVITAGMPVANLTTGIAKGMNNTAAGIGDIIQSIPVVGQKIIPPVGQDAYHAMNQPQGTAQRLGYNTEQAAEWMIPTGAEEKAAMAAGRLSPQIARIAVPSARIATVAGESGVRNQLQGGSFGAGAAAGGAASGIGQAGQKLAPKVVEAALGVGKRIRGSLPEGANVGKAVLEETTGVRPQTIANQLTDRIGHYSRLVDHEAQAAKNAGQTMSLSPARTVVNDELNTAAQQNSASQIKNLNKLKTQLATEFDPATGKVTSPAVAIPPNVDPVRGRFLKQGIGMDVATWNPAEAKNITPAQQRVYGAINEEFHNAVPAARAWDAKMGELIPAYKAASGVANNGGIIEDVSNRLERPTGALVSAAIGGATGAAHGGIPGAILGSAGSLAAPALASLPASKMAIARGLNLAPELQRVVLPAFSLAGGRPLKPDEENPR